MFNYYAQTNTTTYAGLFIHYLPANIVNFGLKRFATPTSADK